MGHSDLGIVSTVRSTDIDEIFKVDFVDYQNDLFGINRKQVGDLFAEISERNEISFIVVDRNITILSCNRAAHAMLKKGDGLIAKGQSFTALRASEKLLLSKAIKQAIVANADTISTKFDPPTLLISRSERLPLTVSIVPTKFLLPSGDTHSHDVVGIPAAIVLVVDPETPLTDSIRRVCELYGLTPAETRLAELLIDGLTLAEIADAMRLKVSTVRAYLKQIFLKTGVNRQPMLIRMLLTTRIPMVIKN
jgi:DNA-binding CsgD family transcriptional regulator